MFKFRVVLCRIRLFPTLISKIKWLWSELPLIKTVIPSCILKKLQNVLLKKLQTVFHDMLEYASVITFLHINENQYEIMVYRLAFHPWKLRLQLSILQGQEAKGLHEEDQPSWNDVIGIPTCHIFFFSFKDRIENRKVNIQNLFYVSSPFTRYSQKMTLT